MCISDGLPLQMKIEELKVMRNYDDIVEASHYRRITGGSFQNSDHSGRWWYEQWRHNRSKPNKERWCYRRLKGGSFQNDDLVEKMVIDSMNYAQMDGFFIAIDLTRMNSVLHTCKAIESVDAL